jgi:hypothetical protein
MSAAAPGDRLWKSVNDQSIDELDMDDEIKALARRARKSHRRRCLRIKSLKGI